MNNKKVLILDMDGVIIDSEPKHLYEKELLFGKHDADFNIENIYGVVGSYPEKAWLLMENAVDIDYQEKNLKEFYLKNKLTMNIGYDEMVFPYLKYMINELFDEGVIIAIASSSPLQTINQVCKELKIDSIISLKVSGEMFKESKPNPEIYLYALDQLNVDKKDCIVLEDSTLGIQAAKSAGIYTIAREETRFKMNQSQADIVIKDYLECLKVIKRKFKI